MLMALSSYKYVWMLICTENAYHANTRRHRQEGEVALQIQEVAPQIQEVAPTTCVVWHFAPCGTLL